MRSDEDSNVIVDIGFCLTVIEPTYGLRARRHSIRYCGLIDTAIRYCGLIDTLRLVFVVAAISLDLTLRLCGDICVTSHVLCFASDSQIGHSLY